MKSFLSAVSTAFAVLFLAVSLSGCLGEEKATSQGGGVSSSVFDSGKVKLVLKPGVRSLHLYFEDEATRNKQIEAMEQLLKRNGVVVSESQVNSYREHYFSVKVIKDTIILIEASGLEAINVGSAGGIIARWDPTKGNQVSYTHTG